MSIKKLLLTIIILLTVILRFYNLSWGAPYYFHPDERNIAASISQLKINDLNPRFFAYGSLPIYLVYAIGVIWNVGFEQAIIILRFLSAIAGVGTVLFIYLIAKKLIPEKWAAAIVGVPPTDLIESFN